MKQKAIRDKHFTFPQMSLPGPKGMPTAVKRMIAHQVEREMLRQNISRMQLAKSLGTSRAAVNRLLDPDNRSITLQTLERVAELLGRRLQIFFQE